MFKYDVMRWTADGGKGRRLEATVSKMVRLRVDVVASRRNAQAKERILRLLHIVRHTLNTISMFLGYTRIYETNGSMETVGFCSRRVWEFRAADFFPREHR